MQEGHEKREEPNEERDNTQDGAHWSGEELSDIPVGLDHAHHEVLFHNGTEDDAENNRCYRKSIGFQKVANDPHHHHHSHIED